jgi:response regulator RpfG family c-di-GMP phosphodiesterase
MNKYKIVHLDDHKIITDSIRNLVSSNVSNCDFVSFNDTDDAYSYLVKSINFEETIDVFITDFTHHGMNGYELAKSIRKVENKLNRKPIPIILLTMHDNSLSEIRIGLKEKVFDNYISLSADHHELIGLIKKSLSVQ